MPDSFLLFSINGKWNTQHARAAARFASKSPMTAEELGGLVNDHEFQAKLNEVIGDPTGTAATEVLRKLLPLVTVVSDKSDFSPASRKAALTTLYPYVQYSGVPSVFLTIAPDDTHSALSLRMSTPSASVDANRHFPATDEGFLEHLKRGAKTYPVADLDISELGLQMRLAKDPVAATEIFKMLTEAVWTCLLRISPDRASRKTFPLGMGPKGVFGHTRAFFSVTQTQGRLSLHTHMVIWAGLDPVVIQKCAAHEKLFAEIRQVLDSQFVASLPPVHHYHALVRLATEPKQRAPLNPTRGHTEEPAPPRQSEEEKAFMNHFREVMNRCGVHQHSHTCEKGHFGDRGCRYVSCGALWNEHVLSS